MKIKPCIILSLFLWCSCSNEEPAVTPESDRTFKMGFSTWTFGPSLTDRDATYAFIQSNGDIYSEQVDDRIPWNAWINGTSLPADFVANIDYRVGKIDKNLQLVLSISPLNTTRDDLIEDWSGVPVSYSALNDEIIENAFFKHVEYLVQRFNPDYLISSMESNDLLNNSTTKWEEYKLLMNNIRPRIKQRFPSLQVSESITLHNFFQPQVDNPNTYIQEISDYADQFDFAAISFYPFFKNQHSKSEFQAAFDFLHGQINKPLAFVETNHLSEDLIIPSLNTNITSNPTEQKEYLEVLVSNAEDNGYLFIIWWAHRDYDALWETFPDEVKAIGQIWRDTGLLDENGTERPAFSVWQSYLQK